MSRTGCPSLDTLSDFVLGKLPISELGTVAEHLDVCPECEQKTGQLDGMADAVVSELRRIPGPDPGVAGDSTVAAGRPRAAGMPSATEDWGEFRIVREIGRGGMGVVCEAYQGSLNRHVAVKFLPERGDLARFRREARAAGRLHHTNIVPVFGVGEHQGRAYYVMQFIAGRGLDRVLKDRAGTADGAGVVPGRFDDREAARVGVQAAEALAYAHAQGVIHRDIKPSNLLLDERGTVWVTDFGLAHDASDTQSLTNTGDFVGTLRYLAPERLEGRGDARADIYGLGVTLYELACGRPAYAEADRAILLHQLLNHDPPGPRQREARIARDFETIVLKAMARDPEHRYATAGELAEDLRRFLDDRPIRARRAGPWERGVRWCRRNKAVSALLAALIAVFLAGFAGVTLEWRRAEGEAARANTTAKAEAQARADESALRIRIQAELSARGLEQGIGLARQGNVDDGIVWMAEALEQTPAERSELAAVMRANLAGWEGRMPRRRAILEHGASVNFAAFGPDARLILTGSSDRTAQFWETATGRPLGPPLEHTGFVLRHAFSPDGRLAATGCDDGSVRLWDTATGRAAGPVLVQGLERQSDSPVASLAFSPDGRLLVACDRLRGARLWDVATGRRLGLPAEANSATSAEFSPDGRHVLLVDRGEQQIRTWDRATGRIGGPTIVSDHLQWARYSPDGRLIVTGSERCGGRLWDAATGRVVASLPPDEPSAPAIFSPDGRLMLTYGWRDFVRIWDLIDNRPTGTLRAGWVSALAFSPDGRFVLSEGHPNSGLLWDLATGHSLRSVLRHSNEIWGVSFSPDGRLVLTASQDGTAQLWEIGGADPIPLPDTPERSDHVDGTDRAGLVGVPIRYGGFSRDGSRVVLGDNGLARLIETETGQPIGRPVIHRWPSTNQTLFSPDGRRFATSSHDGIYGAGGSTWSTCQVWDVATGRPVSPLLPHINWPAAMAFSPDGKVLATGDYSWAVHRWDVETGARIGRPFAMGGIVVGLAFSPDGRLLAAGTAEPAYHAVLWDLESGRRRGEPVPFGHHARAFVFSPDGTRLAAGTSGTARIVETSTGRVLSTFRLGGPDPRIAFTRDGRQVFALSGSPARLWDAATGEPASPPMAMPGGTLACAAALSPDFTSFALCYADGSVVLWDIATARTIGAGWRLREPGRSVVFGRDGRTLSAVDGHGNVRTWRIPQPAAGPVASVVRDARVRAGRAFTADRSIQPLAPRDWRRLRDEGGDPEPPGDATDEWGWHEASARDAETMGHGYGARWHLDRLIAARPGVGLLHARRARARLWEGNPASAAADIDRALALGPRDRILDWMAHRALDFHADKRPADAIRLLDRVIAERPDDWLAYALRAEDFGALGRPADREADLERAIARGADIPFLARIANERSRAGRWAEAVPLYDRAIAMGTVPYEVWIQAATAHLEIEDVPGFRRVCQAMRDRHPAEIDERLVIVTLASVATLAPGGVGDDGKVPGWIAQLVPPADSTRAALKRAILQCWGAILYRTGQYNEAISRTEESIALGKGEATPDDVLILAMAHFQAGDHARAQALLARPWRDEPDGPSAEDWWAARGRRLMRREAERLILEPPFPADVFAH